MYKHLFRGVIMLFLGYWLWHVWIITYASPVNIIMSFALFLVFVRYEFHSRIVNFFASASLMIYMFHISGVVKPFLVELDKQWLHSMNYFVYLTAILGLIICVILASSILNYLATVAMKPIVSMLIPMLDKFAKPFLLKSDSNI